jgi:hypothetical protein
MGLVETPSLPHNDGVSMLSEEALQKFKELYGLTFGQELDDETAVILATNLLNFYNKVYRPIKSEWSNKLK